MITPLFILSSLYAVAFAHCDEGWSSDGSSCYKLLSKPLSWTWQNIACLNQGGKLASIHSAATNHLLLELSAGAEVYTGGASYGPFGPKWTWSDGEPFNFTNFALHSDEKATSEKPCIALATDGKWHAKCCSIPLPGLCRRPHTPNNAPTGNASTTGRYVQTGKPAFSPRPPGTQPAASGAYRHKKL